MGEIAKLPWETRADGWQPWPGAIQILSADGEIIAYTTSGANEKINAAFIVKACNAHADLVKALEEIAKGQGAFSLDPLTHASNTIDDMKAIAREALAKAATS